MRAEGFSCSLGVLHGGLGINTLHFFIAKEDFSLGSKILPVLIIQTLDPDPHFPKSSVADPDPGSGAFLTPGSGIRNRFFPDPGSRIPDPKPIFLRAW